MTDVAAPWTIAELSQRVADALASDYTGQTNGRVRDVPDVRTIRWYTSIGLLDRPAAMRGRTALYGPRHLAQIVAIKRLQAAGHTLAEVQERLIGTDDSALTVIARLPVAAAPSPPASPAPAPAPAPSPSPAPRARFWAAEPTGTTAPTAPTAPTTDTTARPGGFEHFPAPLVPQIQGVRLDDDVTLLLTAAVRTPDDDELAAIREAARPLLELLGCLDITAS